VTPVATIWVYLVVSAALSAWLLVRFPSRRPKSVVWALVAFAAGQIVANIGLVLLPAVMRLPHGSQLALPAVILPVFLVLWLTLAWLLWAIVDTVGRPRGGHPVHRKHLARSRT
jgi:hypothetical protein